jgi:hypothetical protein
METRPTISPFEYLLAVLREWRKIAFFVIAAAVIAGVVSFLLPKWYVSSVTVLPPRSSVGGGMGSISSLLRDFAPVGGANRMASPSQAVNYMAILRSRRTAETLVRRFDLVHVYDIADGSMEKAITAFQENYSMDVADDGSIRVDFSDKDSVRAAAIANGVVDVLNTIAIEMGVNEAHNNRMFLEKRVGDARIELSKAEETLKMYQVSRGMPLLLSDDARAAATAIGDLYTKRLRLDIELSVLKQTAGEDNSNYRQLSVERAELERRLAAFPQLGMEAFRLYRDLLIQQKILEFLVPLYEQSRIDEQKDIPVVLVLDKAVPAERKDRPKRSLIVAVAGVTAFLVALFSIVIHRRYLLFAQEHPERVAALLAVFAKRRVT